MPTTAKAQSNGDDNNQLPEKKRSPAQNPHAYITYDETTGMAYVCFVSAVNDAEVIVYRDGEVVDSQIIDAVTSTQIPIDLSAYGTGEFTIQVRRDIYLSPKNQGQCSCSLYYQI